MYLQQLYQIDTYHEDYCSYTPNSYTPSKRCNSNSITKASLSTTSHSFGHKTPIKIKRCRTQQTTTSETIYYQFTKEVLRNRLQVHCYELCNAFNYKELRRLFSHDDLHPEPVMKINWRYEEGNTLLHMFSEKGHVAMVEFLLGIDEGIDVNARNNIGRTPLHLAVINRHLDMVDLLLGTTEMNVNCQDEQMYTPLMIATIKGYKEIVEYLLVKNAEIGLRNRYSQYVCDLIRVNDDNMKKIYKKYISEDDIRKNCTAYAKIFKKDYVRGNYLRRDIVNRLLDKSKKVDDYIRHHPLFKHESLIKHNQASNANSSILKEIHIGKNISINGLIGRGGFADIFSVYFNHKPQTHFALKVMKKSKVLHSSSKKASILTERSILSKLHNPFIAKFYHAFQNSTHLMLLIELLPHGDLKSYMKTHPNTLNEEDIKIISSQIILAIEHLHKQNIVYRDLKPENILIDKEGFIKLIDFGLSKKNIDSDTACKSFCGSLAYLSPDVIKEKGYGRGVDWYSLGVVLYEMVYGYPPYFTLEGKEALIENIQYGDLLFNPSKNISPELKNLIMSLLERNMKKRLCAGPSDADEIKAHAFYKGINFNGVIYTKHFIPPKKLTMNKLNVINDYDKSFIHCKCNTSNNGKTQINNTEYYLKGWNS